MLFFIFSSSETRVGEYVLDMDSGHLFTHSFKSIKTKTFIRNKPIGFDKLRRGPYPYHCFPAGQNVGIFQG